MDLLCELKVEWTSIDVLRMGIADEYYYLPAPGMVWIGVTPGTLSGKDGVVVAYKCRGLLRDAKITDVEVEIRESVVIRFL